MDTSHVDVDDAGRDDIDVVEVVDALAARQMQLPLILRFPDILRHRMQELQACFSAAMSKFDYRVGLPLFFSSLAPHNITQAILLDQSPPVAFGPMLD